VKLIFCLCNLGRAVDVTPKLRKTEVEIFKRLDADGAI
jgi:hypothetical protein